WLFIGIMLLGFACFVLARRASDIDRIKNGARQVRNGNVSHKIPELKFEDMKKLAENINDIAKGLDESVSAQVKAERLKSELITNVSHDLKTPITSIISYTELLSKIDGLPEEAKDYVAVIAKKSDRLKKLTQDLFDISKVQSGNESITLEKLDVSLLINQALAEQDNEIQSSGLPFCVDAPKELYIFADGRKMSRVVNNLINNILKYTLKNTRVFITAKEKNDNIEIEFKNISAYPLDFNVDEITQRFVRGDESRTAEGNGLGLAIAKSYTEICNGTFEIITDGDMFKAILKFKKYI
ncbi:MAG: HAMP domain-containing histidine kinase, partial [Oscillospiraceae bacterium]|nr:HAMP domain-containing histidine kinase [Oscillospiraceae bacterium]